jgi:hypothetical protein
MDQTIRLLERAAVCVALILPLAILPALAQTLSPDSGPVEERASAMNRLMTEMKTMLGDMDRLHAEMVKPGMAAMRDGMRDMRDRMGRMSEMLERHREQCTGMTPTPKAGG